MKIKLKNIYKPRTEKMRKIMLALKGFIGAISVTSYIQKYEHFAFWLLVGGALLDFLSQIISNEENNTSNNNIN